MGTPSPTPNPMPIFVPVAMWSMPVGPKVTIGVTLISGVFDVEDAVATVL